MTLTCYMEHNNLWHQRKGLIACSAQPQSNRIESENREGDKYGLGGLLANRSNIKVFRPSPLVSDTCRFNKEDIHFMHLVTVYGTSLL